MSPGEQKIDEVNLDQEVVRLMQEIQEAQSSDPFDTIDRNESAMATGTLDSNKDNLTGARLDIKRMTTLGGMLKL